MRIEDNPNVKACCKVADNRKIVMSASDRVVEQCQVCSCKHYRVDGSQTAKFEPGSVKIA